MKILVLDAHANASLAIVQSLGRAGGYEITLAGAESTALSFRSRYPSRRLVYPHPLAKPDDFRNWLQESQDEHRFDFILPVTDSSIHPTMEMRRGGWGADFLILPPEKAFDWVYNKEKTLELARRCQVQIPESIELADRNWVPDPFERFPYFVKPVQSKVWTAGSGSNLAPQLARDRDELIHAVNRFLEYGKVSVQEYVVGWGAGLGTLCQEGEILTWFAYRRVHEYPLTGGASTYRVSCEPPDGMVEAATRMMRHIAWTGVAMIEFKEHADNLVLMEINGRFWGSLPLAIASGVDFPADLLRLLVHGKRPVQPSYRRGLFVRRIDNDFAWFKQNLRADKRDPFLLTRPVGRSLLEPLRTLYGKERWDHASWHDPRPIAHLAGQIASEEWSRRWGQLRDKLVLRQARKTTRRRLRRSTYRRLLVLCYGNICRSPYVERHLKSLLAGTGLEVRSSGFHRRGNRETPTEFAPVAARSDVGLEDHRSTVIDESMVDWADAIVIMDLDNWRRLEAFSPSATEKVLWLGGVLPDGPVEIADPYGRPREEMERIVTRMTLATETLARDLQAGAPRS